MIPLWFATSMIRLVADRVAGARRDERGAIDNVLWYAAVAVGVLVVVAIFIAKMKSRAESTPTE